MPVFHDLIQRSPEWAVFRKSRITATDMVCIMGLNNDKTAYELWKEKLDISSPSPVTKAMQRGADLESQALDVYCKASACPMKPATITHCLTPWAAASLDGISYDSSRIVEIKCMGKENHGKAMDGFIDPKYNVQMQWQMFCADLQMCDYFVYSEESHKIIPVFRDESLIQEMIVNGEKFLDCLNTITPPELSDNDYVDFSNHPNWDNYMSYYADYDEMEKKGREGKEYIKLLLIHAANGKNVKGFNSKFTKVITKGRINYSKIPQLQGLDLESFRGDPVESYRITFTKETKTENYVCSTEND